jgi:hypothetical protein
MDFTFEWFLSLPVLAGFPAKLGVDAVRGARRIPRPSLARVQLARAGETAQADGPTSDHPANVGIIDIHMIGLGRSGVSPMLL